jgi:hypothetical protein
LEAWVFGLILALVGFLAVACGLGEAEFSFTFLVSGLVGIFVGTVVFLLKFKKWFESI